MSLQKTAELNCPHCDSKQNLNYYSSVNVTLEPKLKEKVVSAKLNATNCSECSKEINISTGFLYHDMEKRIMINLKVSDEPSNFEKSEVLNDLSAQGYIYRDVTNYPELLEKIAIFDLGLNDKIIEKISMTIKKSFDEVIKDNTLHVFFDKIHRSLFKKKVVFKCFTHPSQLMKMEWNISNLSKEDRNNLFNIDSARN